MSALIVGIGGTTREGSSSEGALRVALKEASRQGAEVRIFSGTTLRSLPLYEPGLSLSPFASDFIEAISRCDGVVISSPAYHGLVSGLVKNALDYVEETRDLDRPYLTDRPVGCISVAHGWQAAAFTLQALRSIGHSLRGWPTPYGATLNALETSINTHGEPVSPECVSRLRLVGDQVMQFVNSGMAESRLLVLEAHSETRQRAGPTPT